MKTQEKSTVGALLERVREAKKPDWRLDEEILRAAGWQVRKVTRLGLNGRTAGGDRAFPPGTTSTKGYPVPKPTSDLNAIVGLIEAQLPGWGYELLFSAAYNGNNRHARATLFDGKGTSVTGDNGYLATLALCAAFLAAKIATEPTP